jgi:hypothetical protein
LELDDGFGTLQAQRETGIVALNPGQFRCQRIRFGGLRSALAGNQGAEGSGIAFPAPVGERRGVEPFATQDGADPTGLRGAIGFGQDAQLVLRGEGPAARANR